MSPLPTLVYDGECTFCRYWIEKVRRLTGDAVHYRPYQEVAGQFPMIELREFEEAVQWIESGTEGERVVLSGADAVFRALEFAPWPFSRFGAWAGILPGGMRLCRWGYGWVARHRAFFSRWTCRLGRCPKR